MRTTFKLVWAVLGAYLCSSGVCGDPPLSQRGTHVTMQVCFGDISLSFWKELRLEGVLDGAAREQNPKLPPEVLGIWNSERVADFCEAWKRERDPPYLSAPRVTVPWSESAKFLITREASFPPTYTDPDIGSQNHGVNAVRSVPVPARALAWSKTPKDWFIVTMLCRASLLPRKEGERGSMPLLALEVRRRLGPDAKDTEQSLNPVLNVVMETRQTVVLKGLLSGEDKSVAPGYISLELVSPRMAGPDGQPVD